MTSLLKGRISAVTTELTGFAISNEGDRAKLASTGVGIESVLSFAKSGPTFPKA